MTRINPTEAAEILGVSRQRVHQFIQEGRLRARRDGHHWVLDRRSVQSFARKKRRTGRPRKKKS